MKKHQVEREELAEALLWTGHACPSCGGLGCKVCEKTGLDEDGRKHLAEFDLQANGQ